MSFFCVLTPPPPVRLEDVLPSGDSAVIAIDPRLINRMASSIRVILRLLHVKPGDSSHNAERDSGDKRKLSPPRVPVLPEPSGELKMPEKKKKPASFNAGDAPIPDSLRVDKNAGQSMPSVVPGSSGLSADHSLKMDLLKILVPTLGLSAN